mmetsp:Transcript_144358/g.350513  ORF Transcript_144358/g.350513 Transcript_144358/m.350513 type:complete len:270 (+) Transcript_144358:486-1295(+)
MWRHHGAEQGHLLRHPRHRGGRAGLPDQVPAEHRHHRGLRRQLVSPDVQVDGQEAVRWHAPVRGCSPGGGPQRPRGADGEQRRDALQDRRGEGHRRLRGNHLRPGPRLRRGALVLHAPGLEDGDWLLPRLDGLHAVPARLVVQSRGGWEGHAVHLLDGRHHVHLRGRHRQGALLLRHGLLHHGLAGGGPGPRGRAGAVPGAGVAGRGAGGPVARGGGGGRRPPGQGRPRRHLRGGAAARRRLGEGLRAAGGRLLLRAGVRRAGHGGGGR